MDLLLKKGGLLKHKMKKKKWKKPELIVLVRSNPEENVLKNDCKSNTAPDNTGDAQNADGHGCQAISGGCGACQGLGGAAS